MKKIYIFERECCSPTPSLSLVTSLQERFGDNADVRAFNIGSESGKIPMPVALLLDLQQEGASCLPALVVDNTTVTKGWLPNPLEAAPLIDRGEFVPKSTDALASTSASTSCASTGASDCCSC